MKILAGATPKSICVTGKRNCRGCVLLEACLVQISPRAEYDLLAGGTVIGRGTTAAVRVMHPSISREHARILNQGGIWRIMDLGSSNGTLVNQMPLRGVCRLHNGDHLRLGNCEFLFQCPPGRVSSGSIPVRCHTPQPTGNPASGAAGGGFEGVHPPLLPAVPGGIGGCRPFLV